MSLSALNHQILRSDILRVTILMVFFLFLAVYAEGWVILSPDQFNVIFKNMASSWSPSSILLGIALYYFLLRIFLSICE